jgi:hypothetical protein
MPQLPAWKLLNLRKLNSRNVGRFIAQHDELAASFKNREATTGRDVFR